MKKVNLLILAVAIAAAISVRSFSAPFSFNKSVDIDELTTTLKDNAFAVNYIACAGTDCKIHWNAPEAKDPTTHINAASSAPDLSSARTTRHDRIKVLAAKLRGSTITNAERDELIGLMLERWGL